MQIGEKLTENKLYILIKLELIFKIDHKELITRTVHYNIYMYSIIINKVTVGLYVC